MWKKRIWKNIQGIIVKTKLYVDYTHRLSLSGYYRYDMYLKHALPEITDILRHEYISFTWVGPQWLWLPENTKKCLWSQTKCNILQPKLLRILSADL
jgi:hypothetical protein